MLRLITLYMLLALAVAQNGYDYSKPRNPFPSSSSRPGFPSGPSGSYPTTTSYPGRQQNDDYAGTSTPGFPPGPSNYPTGPQGYPGSSSQRPQTGFPGQGPSYTGQDDYSGQNGQSYSGGPGTSRYPGGSGFGPSTPGFGFGSGTNGYRPGSAGFGQGSEDTGEYEGGDYSAIPGQPDIDYPILSYIPSTSFSCDSQSYPGYYADVETRCQVFHVCANNKTYDFLCPNGTIFSQEVLVCVWWDQFDCNSAPSLYGLNANLYDYSITGSQTGFNDYSQGPRGPSYSGRPQGPNSGFPDSSGPQGPFNGYPGSGPSYQGSGPQGPSTSYPGSGPSSPGSSRPSGPGSYPTSTPYPGINGSQGPSSSGGSYPGSGPSNYPGSNSGYPSGKPSGPGYPTGNGRPEQPNREYLPPN